MIADPKNPALYTNRAMARLKMSLWESVVSDCNDCLELSPDSMKAHYYLSQAQLALHNPGDALEHAKRAHALCVVSGDKSLASITAQVLRCKKEHWDDMERRRKREGAEVESEVLAMMQGERDGMLRDAAGEAERREIGLEWEQKMAQLRNIFERARVSEDRRRTVPDWAIDDISFGIMVDPVIVRMARLRTSGGPSMIC